MVRTWPSRAGAARRATKRDASSRASYARRAANRKLYLADSFELCTSFFCILEVENIVVLFE